MKLILKRKNSTVTKKRAKTASGCDRMSHLQIKFAKNIIYQNVRDHRQFTGKCRGTAHSIYNLRFNQPKEILAVFHNGLNYNYHYIIKELVNNFEE